MHTCLLSFAWRSYPSGMVLVYLRLTELITRNLLDPGERCRCLCLFQLSHVHPVWFEMGALVSWEQCRHWRATTELWGIRNSWVQVLGPLSLLLCRLLSEDGKRPWMHATAFECIKERSCQPPLRERESMHKNLAVNTSHLCSLLHGAMLLSW